MGEYLKKKIGVLGGGQLGKMLCEAAHPLGIQLHILDQSDSFPAAAVTPNFVEGNFQNYHDVVQFGKDKDILTIEIENVDTSALHYLEKNGIKVYPQPAVIDLIKDKGKQKEFYAKNHLPTSAFNLYTSPSDIITDIKNGALQFPFVQKLRTGGYDGRGVQMIHSDADLPNLFSEPSLVEAAVDIVKEIAVIIARSPSGSVRAFPAVEMEFHPTANLVEFLFSPCSISKAAQKRAEKIAINVAEKLNVVGLLAVELFVDKSGDILINEVAPRPHNSGHHTIEANTTSQYEQHLRAILDLPLGNTDLIHPAVMANILGADGHTGKAIYKGVDKAFEKEGVHIHLYGKEMTKPYRKMGHYTVVNADLAQAKKTARNLQSSIQVVSKQNGQPA